VGGDLGGLPAAPMILFFTYRVSLDTWAERGILERESALYRRLLPHVGGVAFVTYGTRDAEFGPRLGGIRVLPRPRWLPAAWMSLLAPLVYRREIRAARVLKTNQAAGGWTAVIAKWLFGKPLIARCGYAWSFNRSRESAGLRLRLILLFERLVVRSADLVAVTSTGVGEYLVAAHAVDPRRLRVVPSWIDTERFAPGRAVEREKGLVVSVGRLSPEKNLSLLVEAIARVPGARLELIGEGPERLRLARLAESEGVPLTLAGTVPNAQVSRLLNRAELFVLTSRYEGQPKSLLEAMACGLPVVGASAPGTRDLIRHGETGWLCEPDAESLAAAMRALLEDPGLRDRLGRNARAEIVREHSTETVLAREIGVIRELA